MRPTPASATSPLDPLPEGVGRPLAHAAPWLPLAALVLLAALLRFPTLATQSVWFDEAATWELTRLSFADMLRALPGGESNPPLYYVLEWAWTHALGDGEWGLRSLSAVVGTLTVPVAYGIGRRVGGPRAAVATAALVAVNPLLVWFSQEARSYQLVALLSACSLLLLLRSLDDPRPRVLAWWALAAVLALCSHYFAAFVLAPQAVWLVWRHPRRPAALAAVGALAASGLALLPLLLAQRDNPYDIAGASLAVRLLQVPKQFLLGYRGPLALLAGALGALLIAVAVWLLARHARPAVRRRALLSGAVGATGVALPLLAALSGADYVNARNLLPALVPLAAVLGAGFAAAEPARARRAGTAALATLCSLSVAIVVAVALDSQYQRPNWRGLADALGTAAEQRVVVVSPANGALALRYYRRGLRPLGPDGVPIRAVDVVGVATSAGPGGPRRLPPRVGTTLAAGAFAAPRLAAGDGYAILRFRQPSAVQLPPITLSPVRFGERPPSVELLPAGP